MSRDLQTFAICRSWRTIRSLTWTFTCQPLRYGKTESHNRFRQSGLSHFARFQDCALSTIWSGWSRSSGTRLSPGFACLQRLSIMLSPPACCVAGWRRSSPPPGPWPAWLRTFGLWGPKPRCRRDSTGRSWLLGTGPGFLLFRDIISSHRATSLCQTFWKWPARAVGPYIIDILCFCVISEKKYNLFNVSTPVWSGTLHFWYSSRRKAVQLSVPGIILSCPRLSLHF